MQLVETKILIVGAGPAGISTALYLQKMRPGLASETVVLEKAKHPRHKLCGGGVTSLAEQVLEDLEISLDMPSFAIHQVDFLFSEKPINFKGENLMRTVRRDEFDFALVSEASKRGVTIFEEEAVQNISREANGFLVETDRHLFRCKVLVGADGAKSFVRKKMFAQESGRVSRLMETVVPIENGNSPEFNSHTAVFDFRAIKENLQGYLWDFPSLVKGKPHLNIGIFDSRVYDYSRPDLKKLLREKLANRAIRLDKINLEGHPERWFSSQAQYARPNLVLVGDAAGIEPWLGEGISIALAYGSVAAAEIIAALSSGNFEFRDYTKRINQDRLGALLNRNRKIAKLFYAKPSRPLLQVLVKLLEISFRNRQTATP